MTRFLCDYDSGLVEGRYIAGSLPALPFADGKFDLGLCSHLLFLYSDQLDFNFHLAAVIELMRVAREVRIFPLFDLDCRRSAYLDPVRQALEERGLTSKLVKVPHGFQKARTRCFVCG